MFVLTFIVLRYMNKYGTSSVETAAIFNIPSPSTSGRGKDSLKHTEWSLFSQRKRGAHQ